MCRCLHFGLKILFYFTKPALHLPEFHRQELSTVLLRPDTARTLFDPPLGLSINLNNYIFMTREGGIYLRMRGADKDKNKRYSRGYISWTEKEITRHDRSSESRIRRWLRIRHENLQMGFYLRHL